MKCHVLSCDVMGARCSALLFAALRSDSSPSVPPSASLGRRMQGVQCNATGRGCANPTGLGGRGDERGVERGGETGGNVMKCHVRRRKCHVLSCGAVSAGLSVRSSSRPAARVSAAGVGFGHACLLPGRGRDGVSLFRARFARAGVGAGARFAPARFARLIARARRHTHLARPFPPGSFSRPQPSLSAEKPKGGPKEPPLSLLSFYTKPAKVKPLWKQKVKISGNFLTAR